MTNTCFDASHHELVTSLLRWQIDTPEFTQQEVEELREEATVECNFRHIRNLRKYDVKRAAA